MMVKMKPLLVFLLLLVMTGLFSDDTQDADLKAIKAEIAKGNAEAMNRMGMLYYDGRQVSQSKDEAMRHFRMAAEKNYPLGAYNLAVCLEDSHAGGLFAEACKFYLQAANHGFAPAMYALGVNYHQGRGVTQSHEQAYFWILLACAQANGDQFDEFAKARDNLATWLSAEEIKAQQKNALDWTQKNAARIAQTPQLRTAAKDSIVTTPVRGGGGGGKGGGVTPTAQQPVTPVIDNNQTTVGRFEIPPGGL
ncbi:MAG: sel1 repeat family protein [Candidatus Syntrophosphaera sp.]|nr:sel1 repeat family protein [Candidatus Syntrophosphaera sp.]